MFPQSYPVSPICIDDEMQALLSDADRRLGRLDGITQVLPNPDLFLAMYVKKEAILSSQIEVHKPPLWMFSMFQTRLLQKPEVVQKML